MRDVVIDIETAGKGPKAAVLAIGAVQCDLTTGERGASFYATIRPADAYLYGDRDNSTLQWWGEQPEEARREAFGGEMLSHSVACAFSQWLVQIKQPIVWGNGPTFDITILENLYAAHRLPVPWKFWNIRDVRTVVDLGERLRCCRAKSEQPFEGTQHHALHDAIHEAAYMVNTIKALRGG